MTLPTPLLLKGAPGSPYTRKMLAYLRYRQIPYRLLLGTHGALQDLPKPKVELLPTFYLPDAAGNIQAVVDSTPLIRRFEAEFAGRAAAPSHPVLNMLDALLEDYGDEWLTKAMFHYRWYYQADIDKAATILPRWHMVSAPEAEIRERSAHISKRQISRLYVVGSNDTTAPVIENSYKRFLDLFDAHLQQVPFLLGQRPGASDFACYAQLTQLAQFDPTPMAETLARSPRTFAWVDVVEDLSGLDPTDDGWLDPAALPATLTALLTEVGRVYAPALLANAQALMSGADTVQTSIDGQPWVQQPFPYQAKCLQALRQQRDALSEAHRAQLDGILAGTGCEPLFT